MITLDELKNTSARAAKRILRPARALLQDGARGALRIAEEDWRSVSVAASRRGPQIRRHLLIAASGNRNMGDQAMLEAFLHESTGPVTVVVEPGAVYELPVSDRDVVLRTVPYLLRGPRKKHRAAVDEFALLLREHLTLTVVGADVVDGGYHRHSAATTWAIAGAAAELGVNTRVLGFSWRPRVERELVEIARRAIEAGVVALVRDPHSFQRFADDGLGGRPVADTVFVLPGAPREGSLVAPSEILLNLSGLIHTRVDLTVEYVALVRGILDRGLKITLLAHVDSPNASDFVPIRALLAALGPELSTRVAVRESLPMPTETIVAAARATIVITGRMHMAILGFLSGTPAIILSTQGKVSGLVELVGLPEWSVEPRKGLASRILDVLDSHLREPTVARRNVTDQLPHIRELARQNFNGLGDHAN